MPESKMLGPYTVIIIVALGVAALWFLKDSILAMFNSLQPNKDAPTSTQTGTTASGAPIVGSDVKYVNPLICMMTGQYCDPNRNANTVEDPTSANPNINPNIVGLFQGQPVVEQHHQDGSIHGYVVTMPFEGPTVYCERDPSLQQQKVTSIVGKMNKGINPSLEEAMWAKKCEPTLYNMMGGDLKSQVDKATGVV